jgi:hypothetical protein
MLPGFRFLFAAIVLCMSVLVFGLGAAALLRAAHEDFASNPSWRTPPEPRFAQQEATSTVLAVLSVQPSPIEPAAAPKAAEPDPAATTGSSATASPSPSPGPETTATLTPTDASPAEGVKPAPSATETPARTEPPAQSEPVPTRTEAQTDAPVSAPNVAATEARTSPPPESAAPPPNEPVASTAAPAALPSQPAEPATPGSDQATTRIATLGGPAVTIDQPAAARASHAMLDRSLINKRLQAELAQERAKEHARELRRLAARRARQARQAATVQQQADPFAPHPLAAPTSAR